LQGPAELLPISSSGHLALVPRLLGWQVAELDAGTRKTLEVALHAGSAGALTLVGLRQRGRRLRDALHANAGRTRPDAASASAVACVLARDAGLLGLTFAPPAVIGLLLERPIEQRLGGVKTVALAQIGAGAALWLVDRCNGERTEPGVADHLAVGVGQALALIPGVSRSGAALTAARWRGLDRPAAVRLSFRAALPVTLGATLLKGVRALRGELDPELRAPLAAGALAALVTGVAAAGLAERLERADSLAPLAAYRVALGAAALARSRDRS
jgi:undecaprenyl-diphosphatase